MVKIKNFESFNEGFSKISEYLNRLLKRGGYFASDVWDATKRESQETKMAIEILGRLIKGEEVSDKEKKFLKAQSGDVARIIPLVAISGIPVPIPITPLLVVLGKKYGFDFLPRDHRSILSNQIELPLDIQQIIKEHPSREEGYHVIDLVLKNGRVLNDKKVLNGYILILNPHETLEVDDIEDIVID
jgi:hypothetical protein